MTLSISFLRSRIIVAVILLGATATISSAQFPAQVRPGTRVRVWLPEEYRQPENPDTRQVLRGTVESVDDAALRLRIPGINNSVSIPRYAIRRLDVSHGISRPASMIARAAGGAIGGAITAALMNDPRRHGGPHYRRDWRAAGVGAEWGAGIGAVIGLVAPFELWQRVHGIR